MSHWNQCLRQIHFGYQLNILILLILVFILNNLSCQNVCIDSFTIYWLIICDFYHYFCTSFFNSLCFKYTQYFIVPTRPLDDNYGNSNTLARNPVSRMLQRFCITGTTNYWFSQFLLMDTIIYWHKTTWLAFTYLDSYLLQCLLLIVSITIDTTVKSLI